MPADTDLIGLSDTGLRQFRMGQRVLIGAGTLRGLTGFAMKRLEAGRILVRIHGAVYVEIHEALLVPIETIDRRAS